MVLTLVGRAVGEPGGGHLIDGPQEDFENVNEDETVEEDKGNKEDMVDDQVAKTRMRNYVEDVVQRDDWDEEGKEDGAEDEKASVHFPVRASVVPQ